MTDSQKKAVEWLRDRGGDGVFDRNGILIACGESAPFTRSTWNALAKLGVVEMYKPTGKGRGRLRMSAHQ